MLIKQFKSEYSFILAIWKSLSNYIEEPWWNLFTFHRWFELKMLVGSKGICGLCSQGMFCGIFVWAWSRHISLSSLTCLFLSGLLFKLLKKRLDNWLYYFLCLCTPCPPFFFLSFLCPPNIWCTYYVQAVFQTLVSLINTSSSLRNLISCWGERQYINNYTDLINHNYDNCYEGEVHNITKCIRGT